METLTDALTVQKGRFSKPFLLVDTNLSERLAENSELLLLSYMLK